jgi:D-alanyl-D-alanine carboxypeptidase (penicillin-binding protein 5/6)
MISTRGRLVGAALLLALAPVVAPVSALADSSSDVGGSALAQRGVVVSGVRPPLVDATSWLVADATTGEILAAKNAHLQLRPASTLKTLTAVTLLPRLDKQDVYKVQWEDAAVEGSAVGIVPGAKYTIDQLFYGLLLPSGNDAAHALANAAGGMDETIALMSEEAQQLNALDTTVRNPSGLDAGRQFSSAYDLALFARAGLERKDFRRYVSTISTAFPAEMPKGDKKRKTYQIYNQNPLLLDGYRGAIGVKTGYTTLAGRTFIGAAERGGRTLIISIMGIGEMTDTAAKRLLDWGFTHADRAEPVGSLVAPVGTSHDVRPATAAPPISASSPTESAGGGVGWVAVVTAAVMVLLTWLALHKFNRRPRRAALPPL